MGSQAKASSSGEVARRVIPDIHYVRNVPGFAPMSHT